MQYELAALVTAAVLFASSPASVDAQNGSRIARQWCANCHVVGADTTGVIQEGPPSFRAVAQSAVTDDQLRAFLTHPHGAMPDLSLSRADINDLIAYIRSLR
jgi:cytochrome c